VQKSITYSWRGTGSMSLNLSIDGKPIQVTFDGGKDRPRLNSSFETSDELVQKAIEHTSLYQKGSIAIRSSKVVSVEVPVKAPEVVVITPDAAKAAEEKSSLKGKFTSVKTIQQAADKLHEKYEVPLAELNSPDAILSKAQLLGASFPNLVM